MRQFLFIIILTVTGFTVVSCGKKQADGQTKESSSKEQKGQQGQPGQQGQRGRGQLAVDAVIANPTTLDNQLSVSGSILAFEEVALMSEMSGRVVQVNLPEGQFVKKGTLLVQIYNDDLQANLKKTQAQLENQERILERQTELLKVNGVSQNDYDQTSLLVRTLKADIEAQQSVIRKTQVLAPFDGVVGLKNISIGAMVNTSTLLTTIRMQDKLKLDFSIPEKYSSQIKPGLKVQFSISGKDETYNATVIATEGGIDASTRNIKVRALINSKSEELVPGGFTNVKLSLGENNNAILIPTQAIIPQERNKSVIVAKNGKAHFVQVKTGVRQESKVEITSGVNPGDTVITNGILFLKEGAKLSFSNIKN